MSNRYRGRRRPGAPRVHCYTKEEFIALNESDASISETIQGVFNDIKKFQYTLQDSSNGYSNNICNNHIDVVISLLLKISKGLSSDDDDVRSKSVNILSEVLTERCNYFHSQLKMFVGKAENFVKDPIEKATLVHGFFEALLKFLPNASWGYIPLDEFYETVVLLTESETLDDNGHLLEQVKYLVKSRQAIKDEQHVKLVKANIAAEAKKSWDNSEFRGIQILPRWEEISKPGRPYQLRPNLVKGSYDDWEHYFDVQFRLLREDFLAPLRDGIGDYLMGKFGRELRNVKVYQKVIITRPVITRDGLCHEISFDLTPFRDYMWDHSKRLMFGSLLCLSPDHFQKKIFFATVVNRDPVELYSGKIQVIFQGGTDLLAHMKLKREFVMVESMAYFEASRHILRSLQEAEGIETFSKYIISNDCKEVKLPQYISNNERYNLQFIVKPEYRTQHEFDDIPVSEDSYWPTNIMTDLDESQLKAIKMALTQEIAVIQGPPGTGKTYIGLKIVQALLKNRHIWNIPSPFFDFLMPSTIQSPILVMCFTNHALDQFLEGILEINNDINMVRIGGRSKNEKIEECSLYNVKRKLQNVPKYEYNRVKQMFNEAEMAGAKCNREISNYHDPEREYIPLSSLRWVMDDYHYWSLTDSAESKQEEAMAMDLWLGLCRKEVIKEDEELTRPGKGEHDQQSSDSSEYYTDSDDEAGSDTDETGSNSDEDETGDIADRTGSASKDEHQALKVVETVDIVGEASIEEDSRMVDGMNEMFKEMKFTDDILPDKDLEPDKTTKTGRTFHIIDHENQYELKRYILSQQEMSEEEASDIQNVNNLKKLEDRYRLYKYWHCKYRVHLLQKLEDRCDHFNTLCKEANEDKRKNDRYALDRADVIGMTTTGVAKYQHVLQIVKPKIVIVEEAAEVLESHIISALNTGTQHLILIGDHKQLRPDPNEYELATKYRLEISLFERLVMNGFPHSTLQIQHRMRPQIAELVRGHIYDTLLDHESVQNYPNVKGMEKNLFLIQHEEPEKRSDLSRSNQHEAEYLAALCKFLLQQGYEPSQITILVTYAGQLLLMKNFMPKAIFEGVRVTTVDNFQGEENDIILLSLVRSNDRNSIGFLEIQNRVCVALSRAKHGFYCIGNFNMLRENADIWKSIVSEIEDKGSIGERLSIHCNNHPDYKFSIKYADEFAKYLPTGGCKRPCEYRLTCGHVCERTCHSDDQNHEKYKCQKPCNRDCGICNQPCDLLCSEDCKCFTEVEKKIPLCGHYQVMCCYQDPEKIACRMKCTKELPYCGHEQELRCCEDPYKAKCRNKCYRSCPEGHPCPLLCYQGCYPCQAGCKNKCISGHPCPMKCHEDCGPCNVTVSVKLSCSHTIDVKCGHQHAAKCNELITKTFSCGHGTKIKCYHASTAQCKQEIMKELLCGHTIAVKCHESSRVAKCNLPCEKKLTCGHECSSSCGEPCSCNKRVEVTLKCNHKALVPCHQKRDNSYRTTFQCPKPCRRKLNCNHWCTKMCGEPCISHCQEDVEKTCPQGHKVTRQCFETFEDNPCTKKCLKKLRCDHPCPNICHEACSIKCNYVVIKQYPCGHRHEIPCSTPIEDKPCDCYCRFPLACGHNCRGKCSDCWTTRIHKPCDYNIRQQHYCGETIKMKCVGLSNCHEHGPTKLKVLHCMHTEVPYDCSTKGFNCIYKCGWECPHFKCTKLCLDSCNRPPCNNKCPEILECGHQCIGLCGEPCVNTCHECEEDVFKNLYKSSDSFSNSKACTQLPCGHIFTVDTMDRYTEQTLSSSNVVPLQCPECSAPLSYSYRYGNRMKESLVHVNALKIKMKSASGTQLNLPVDMIVRLKHICQLLASSSELPKPIEEFLTSTIRRTVRREKGFFLFLLAKVFLISLDLKDICRPMLDALTSFIYRNQQLSFQIIHDLTSETYRLITIAKMTLGDSAHIETRFSSKYKHPHSRVSKEDFLSYSKILDLKIPVRKFHESTEDFIGNIEAFSPMVFRGCWMKCRSSHYYCVPLCESGSLTMQCPDCSGTYVA